MMCLSAMLAAYAVVWLSLNIFNIRLTSHSQNTLYIDQTREKALWSFTSGDLHAKFWTMFSNCLSAYIGI